VVVTMEFFGGSLGTVVYAAHGSRSFGKERLEVFGGGKAAVLDDFRRLELVSDASRRTVGSRWRADKGHGGLWRAFLGALASGGTPPIAYSDLFAVTQATLAAVESLRRGLAVELDPAAFDWGPQAARRLERPPSPG